VAIAGASDSYDLAVGLQGQPERRVEAIPEICRLLSVSGKARIERPVRVVAGEGEAVEVPDLIGIRGANHDDLAVHLQRHPARVVEVPDVGRLLAVAGEARIERPVRVVA